MVSCVRAYPEASGSQPHLEGGANLGGDLDRRVRARLDADVGDRRRAARTLADRGAVAEVERLRAERGPARPRCRSTRRSGPARPLERRPSRASRRTRSIQKSAPKPERLHEPRARVVEVREPVRVEHHALAVDLGVPHADAVRERRVVRSSAQLGAVRARRPRRCSCWRSSPTSSSVSVRSGARNAHREREAHPAGAERVGTEHVEQLDADSSSSPAGVAQRARATSPAGHGVGDDEREVDRRGRETRDRRAPRAAVARPASSASTSSSNATTGAGSVERRRAPRRRPRRSRRRARRRRRRAARAHRMEAGRRSRPTSRQSASRSSSASASTTAARSCDRDRHGRARAALRTTRPGARHARCKRSSRQRVARRRAARTPSRSRTARRRDCRARR